MVGRRTGEAPAHDDRAPGTDRDPRRAGRDATTPGQIGGAGWKAVGKRTAGRLKRDHVSLLAAGVAFRALLALFPAIIAAITIWGLVAGPQQIVQQISGFLDALPEEAAALVEQQMTGVAGRDSGALSLALAISLLIALWSASSGAAGLIEGCNAAYDEVDERNFLVKRGIALAFMVGAILFVALAIGLIAILPVVLGGLGLGSTAALLVRVGQWVVLALLVLGGLATVYRYGPDRDHPQARWTSPGAIIATVLWLLGSALFTVYVENFGSFGETYGAFAGIIVLMLWLFLSAFVVLLGAEINAELERQTMYDTTVGEPRPMGSRGAVVADTTPEDVD